VNRGMDRPSHCEYRIETMLSDLDQVFTHQGVNNALDRIFTPARDAEPMPAAMEQLKSHLEQLRAEFGTDLVETALYEVDKRRNPHAPTEKVDVPDPEESLKKDKCVESILRVVRELDNAAIALIVGDDDWEINEFDAKIEVRLGQSNTERNLEVLTKMLSLITQIRDIAASEDSNKEERIKQLGEEFNSL